MLFLLHFPAGFPGSALPTTLPFDVRTFLDSPKAAAAVCLTRLKGRAKTTAAEVRQRSRQAGDIGGAGGGGGGSGGAGGSDGADP